MKALQLVPVMLFTTLVCVPAEAVIVHETVPQGLTLSDFNYTYSGGTKPAVAWHKFQEYQKLLDYAPSPTLRIYSLRTSPEEKTVGDYMGGTKPPAAITQFEAESGMSREIRNNYPVTPAEKTAADYAEGTKPAAAVTQYETDRERYASPVVREQYPENTVVTERRVTVVTD